MSSWYRTGLASVVNGSKIISGNNCYWETAANKPLPGDVFTDNEKLYEIIAINSDNQIELDREYEGVTNASLSYAIIRNTTATTNTRIADQITKTLDLLGERVTVSTTAPSSGQGRDGDIWIVATVE